MTILQIVKISALYSGGNKFRDDRFFFVCLSLICYCELILNNNELVNISFCSSFSCLSNKKKISYPVCFADFLLVTKQYTNFSYIN